MCVSLTSRLLNISSSRECKHYFYLLGIVNVASIESSPDSLDGALGVAVPFNGLTCCWPWFSPAVPLGVCTSPPAPWQRSRVALLSSAQIQRLQITQVRHIILS